MITQSSDLWHELSNLAAFEDTAYDEELKLSIAATLDIDAGNIEKDLQLKSISVEQLLTVFLDALKPFSQMMADLLHTYEAAGARSNHNNIQMEFDFDGVPARFGLDAFRSTVSTVQERTETRTRLLNPWRFLEHLEGFDNSKMPFRHENEIRYTDEIKFWFFQYQHDILPDHLPSFPGTRNVDLDRSLGRIWEIAEDALQQYRKEYDPSVGRRESISNASHKYDTRFWWAETDGWLGKFVKTFFEMSHYYRGVNDASSIIRRIDKLLANRSIFSVVTASEKFTAICEILDMPFWKHRYEMYSAWVFTCIAESVSDLGLSYNVLGGVLQFKFSGALLARVNIPDVEFEIWAEKRYEAENLVGEGRKKHIQPDYSIMKRCNGAGEACLLIECKQYKKSNSRNFAIAVNDYARSRPDANVLLVNYGPISRNLSMRIGSDVRRRYRGYEKMKPLTARRAEFVRDVRDMIDACWADIQFSAGRDLILWEEKPEQLKVELSWNQLPTDLDLSVFFRMPSEKEDCHVYFGHRGLEDGYPFACLDADVRNGPGKETIIIKKIVSGGYDIEVSNYSGEERIDGEIVIRISAGRQFVEEVKRGFWKEKSVWHVGVVNAIGFLRVDEWVHFGGGQLSFPT